MYIVAVRFEISPEHAASFRAAVSKNAAASEATEPGCRQFDACFNADGTNCFLYEVYQDEAAFGVHRASAHFATFSQAIEGSVVNKRLELYDLPDNPYKDL